MLKINLIIMSIFCLASHVKAQPEWHFSTYYAPQSGRFFNASDQSEGTSKHNFFLCGKHGMSAAYYFDRANHFGVELGLARSRTGGNLSQEWDGNGSGPVLGAYYNQQLIYTKVPIFIVLNKGKNDILGFTMKLGFEYGNLTFAQNYFFTPYTLAFGYNNLDQSDVVINWFSRVKHDQLKDYVQMLDGVANYELKKLYAKHIWSFVAEAGLRYTISPQFDLHGTAFLDAGFTNIENNRAKVDGKYFWMQEELYYNYGEEEMARTFTSILNLGLKFSLVYRLYSQEDQIEKLKTKFE